MSDSNPLLRKAARSQAAEFDLPWPQIGPGCTDALYDALATGRRVRFDPPLPSCSGDIAWVVVEVWECPGGHPDDLGPCAGVVALEARDSWGGSGMSGKHLPASTTITFI